MSCEAECMVVKMKGENILHLAEMRILRWIIYGVNPEKNKSGIRLYNYTSGCQNISSGNITRTEQTKLTCSHQEKGRTDNLTKEVMEIVLKGKI